MNSETDSPIHIAEDYSLDFIKSLSEKYSAWYVEGTMFDGGNMVLSCRGVADNEFNVYLRTPFDDEKEESTCFVKFMNSNGDVQIFPNNLQIWVDNEILNIIYDEAFYTHIEFVFFTDDLKNPTFMAQLR